MERGNRNNQLNSESSEDRPWIMGKNICKPLKKQQQDSNYLSTDELIKPLNKDKDGKEDAWNSYNKYIQNSEDQSSHQPVLHNWIKDGINKTLGISKTAKEAANQVLYEMGNDLKEEARKAAEVEVSKSAR